MNIQLLSLFQGKSQVLVEVGDSRHGVAALVGVAAAGGFRLHGWRSAGRRGRPECGARTVQAADASGASDRTAAAAATAAAAQGKGPGPGAGVSGERGWTRREEPARSRCLQQDSL